MIKTIQPVNVDTKDRRDTEQKVVYAEVYKVEIGKGKYVIYIEEFVYDEGPEVQVMEEQPILDSNGDPVLDENNEPLTALQPKEDENGNPIMERKQVKRHIVKINRVRTKQQVQELIDLLQNDTKLTNLGLQDYIGVYDSLNQLERNDFVVKVAHLIENNQDMIRDVNWIKHQ